MKLALQILLPLLVLLGAGAIAAKMIAGMQKPVVQTPPPQTPLVRALAVQPASLRMDVHSQGAVEPKSAVVLSAQVSGAVVAVSKNLRPGAFFAAGEPLVTIDEADYRLALVQQDANVARAELRLAQERAEAEVALRAWQELEGERQADALATRRLFVEEAQAALAAAQATRARADLDLRRTQLALPFAGRVRTASVDKGQFVSPGQPLAEVYDTEYVEVRLPIPDADAAFLDLPLGPDGGSGPAVELYADFAGKPCRWQGQIVRTEGEIDRKTRMLTLVARVESPFAATPGDGQPPLAVGMFVGATITGRAFDSVLALPRAAVRPDGRILVVSAESRLTARPLPILRRDRDAVYAQGALAPGERICTSPIEAFVEGMPVRVLEPQGQDAPQPQTGLEDR